MTKLSPVQLVKAVFQIGVGHWPIKTENGRFWVKGPARMAYQIWETRHKWPIIIHVNLLTGGQILQFFLGHLPISNILPNSPDFYMFLPYSPDFYMFLSQMCKLHHVHLGQGSKMQPVVFWILHTVQKSFILTSTFVLTTLYTHPGLII